MVMSFVISADLALAIWPGVVLRARAFFVIVHWVPAFPPLAHAVARAFGGV